VLLRATWLDCLEGDVAHLVDAGEADAAGGCTDDHGGEGVAVGGQHGGADDAIVARATRRVTALLGFGPPSASWSRTVVAVVRTVILAACACLLAGCGRSTTTANPLPAAPEPAVSPPAQSQLPGVVLALAGGPEGVVVDQAGTVAVNVRQPDGLVIFNLADPGRRRVVAMTGSARHLSLAATDGPLLVPDESDDRLVEVALPTGQILKSIPVGRQPHDAVAVDSDTVFVGDELANTVHVIRDGVVTGVIAGPLQPGGLAADGSVVIAVGVRGRRIIAYRSDGSVIGSANCGVGPTHAATGADGTFWVVDTDGGTVLGFTVDARGPRQVARIAVGSKPYGVAYDSRRSTLWVTLTGTNEVVGLHLSGNAVRSRTVYATVQQPNSVAVDEATGRLLVTGSTTRGAVQVIDA